MSDPPISLNVDGLTFTFPVGWRAWRYDEWSFYRNQFQNAFGGTAAVDIIALEPNGTVWFIEAKNYLLHPRTKLDDLSVEIARKVRDTLSAILPAALSANDEIERGAARLVLSAKKLRVVLHLEQPSKHSKIFPVAADPADLQQLLRLKDCVRSIDMRALVVGRGIATDSPWQVS